MNTTITALQLKYSTQGWTKLFALGSPVDSKLNLDDSTMTTVGVETLEYAVNPNAIASIESLLRGAENPVPMEVDISGGQKKGMAVLKIEKATIL